VGRHISWVTTTYDVGPTQRAGTPVRRRADAVTAICWARATIVAGLWLAGGNLADLRGTHGAVLESLGRLAGLIAADLLLMQVLLMARIPAIERHYGQDELARRHRWVGFASVNLLLAHVGLITVGYALTDNSGIPAEAWSLLTTYPGMLLATASTALLILVAVTSIRVARRKLRYESWHLLHLYAYLGVGLSVPHEIWTGSDFASSGLARMYWWGSYALAAGAVLGYRVGLPVARNLRHNLRVAEVVAENAHVVTVRMTGHALDRLPVDAGQFFVFRFLDGPGWTRGNPYSLSAAPDATGIRITVKDLGDGSGRLGRLQPGTRVLIEGPYGRLTGSRRTRARLVLLACGIGVTPMRALLEELPYLPGEATLIYRAGSAADLILKTELDELAARRGVTVHYLPGPRVPDRDSWLPAEAGHWPDPQALLHLAPHLLDSDVYVCGPLPWMDSVRTAATAAGLPPHRLHEERFAW
jgi:predicted ferric reductase